MQAKHVLLTGSSGGGKTTKAREYHAEFQGASVYLTTKPRETGFEGKQVSGRRALNSVVSDASGPRDAKAKWVGADYDSALATVREWAHDVATHRSWPVQIIVDECQNSGLADGDGPLVDGLHEDRDRGIKWVPTTQDPQDLRDGYSAIKQVEYIVWCGPVKTFHKGFLDFYGIEAGDLPDEPYHCHTIKPTLPPEVVARHQTKSRYA